MKMIDALQIVVTIFALFALSRAILRFKDSKITRGELFFWSIIWAAVIALVFMKQHLGFLSTFFDIERPVDVIVYASIILIFYLIFRMLVKIERIEQEITAIVRKQALEKGKKK